MKSPLHPQSVRNSPGEWFSCLISQSIYLNQLHAYTLGRNQPGWHSQIHESVSLCGFSLPKQTSFTASSYWKQVEKMGTCRMLRKSELGIILDGCMRLRPFSSNSWAPLQSNTLTPSSLRLNLPLFQGTWNQMQQEKIIVQALRDYLHLLRQFMVARIRSGWCNSTCCGLMPEYEATFPRYAAWFDDPT